MNIIRRFLLVLFLTTGVSITMHSEDAFDPKELYLRWAETAIINGTFLEPGRSGEFRYLLDRLEPNDRMVLFRKYQREAWPAMVMNLILPGVGSLMIGDIGSTMLIWGSLFLSIPTFYGLLYVGLGNMGGNTFLNVLSTALALLWLGEVGFAYVYGFCSPGPYVEKWNRELNKRLMIDGVSFFMEPGMGKERHQNLLQLDVIRVVF